MKLLKYIKNIKDFKFKKIIIIRMIIFILVFNTSPDIIAQWEPDVRLTNAAGDSYTSPNNAWCVAASRDTVHVVWQDNRDGNPEIYYKRSTNAGISWGADTRLTNNSAVSTYPSVTVSGSPPLADVHVVWTDTRDGNDEIYYKRSTNAGVSWGADTQLTNNTSSSFDPSVIVSGSLPMAYVHVVWTDERDGNLEIYYKRSTDRGISWGPDTRLTNNPVFSYAPSVSVSGSPTTGVVHVVWMDNRDGNYEIYYKRSTDAGVSWATTDTRLTSNSAQSWYPSVTVSGTVVHVVWMDNRSGLYDIYYKRSTDGGVSWGADTQLRGSYNFSKFPSVTVSGSVVHVVWEDNRDQNYEIYYKQSTDGGTNWGADTRLTYNSAMSRFSSVSVSGSPPMADVHVVWSDYRDGNSEIYYKPNPTGNPIGIININSEIPKDFRLEQNYPNPFNPKTIIKFQIPNSSDLKLIIFDILGREVKSLVNELQDAGYKEVIWDGNDKNGLSVSSGVYFYKIEAGTFTDIKKMVLIR